MIVSHGVVWVIGGTLDDPFIGLFHEYGADQAGAQLDPAGAGLPAAFAIAVALDKAIGGLLATPGAR